MITIYPHETLGHVNHDWLDARHHFSFSTYQNPNRIRFGKLRVVNDDIIKSGKGFDMHPHADMEIITYVRKGAITHRDNQGNKGKTIAGDVQVMSAGTGISHSEFNLEDEDTNLYQIWIESNKKGVKPRWDSKKFPKQPIKNKLTLLVSGSNDAPLFINQDARIYAGRLEQGAEVNHHITHQAYILISDGKVDLEGHSMKKGDGAEVKNKESVYIKADTDAEIIVIDVPE